MALEGTSCLYSVFVNSSGKTMTFSFLPPHGQTLAPGEEFTVIGDATTAIISANGVDRGEAMRALVAYENAVAHGWLQLAHTPNPIVEQPNGTVKMLGLSNAGAITITDPCWLQAAGPSDSIIN